ncbi:hypothetical protein FRC12_021753 [Ceratobasidium sp. 428]|nr:hypothetical protein FRC12_021753 [Ceratobasidium sp. 428]
MSCDENGNIIIAPEAFLFAAEEEVELPAGHNFVRTMNAFLFRRGKKLLRFDYKDNTDEFWRGVVVRGIVAPLRGSARYHRMAGWWDWRDFQRNDRDMGGGDIELMELRDIVGLTWETDPAWRGGKEPIMMLHTRAGYYYALQHPNERFKTKWLSIVRSYATKHEGRSALFRTFWGPGKPGWWTTVTDHRFFLEKLNDISRPIEQADDPTDVDELSDVESASEQDAEGELDEEVPTSQAASEPTVPMDVDNPGEGEGSGTANNATGGVPSDEGSGTLQHEADGAGVGAGARPGPVANEVPDVTMEAADTDEGGCGGDGTNVDLGSAIDSGETPESNATHVPVPQPPAQQNTPPSLSLPPRLDLDRWRERRASAARETRPGIAEADTEALVNMGRGLQASNSQSVPTPTSTAVEPRPLASSSRLPSQGGAPAVGRHFDSTMSPAFIPISASSQSDSGVLGAPSRGESYDADQSNNVPGSQGSAVSGFGNGQAGRSNHAATQLDDSDVRD